MVTLYECNWSRAGHIIFVNYEVFSDDFILVAMGIDTF